MSLYKFIVEFSNIILLIFSMYGLFNFKKAVQIAYKFYNSFNPYNQPFLFTNSYLKIILKLSLILGVFMGIISLIDFISSLLGSSLQKIINLYL
ncbi:hypothetical protein [Tepidibacter thalassicus]|uniref:Uncharacterized protein n=1 Tax=Tepidibacter thalassicus DSM 15285 TaxID=1123350 RepID=A0A1M5RL46_9FIRM|nr:hypothetical protein [Tepidibacter thalassicus]SHH27024.1 hypothetical protein SAMN02744040_01426 [Tepidibacter thalassicus DSM 15285]